MKLLRILLYKLYEIITHIILYNLTVCFIFPNFQLQPFRPNTRDIISIFIVAMIKNREVLSGGRVGISPQFMYRDLSINYS